MWFPLIHLKWDIPEEEREALDTYWASVKKRRSAYETPGEIDNKYSMKK